MRSKIITALVLLSLGIVLTACSMSERAAAPAEPKPSPTAADSVRQPFGRILIAYFSRADNTQVQNPTAIDPDAVTSASLLPPGNTAVLASLIQQNVGGDILSIKVQEPYPEDYEQCLERAVNESTHRIRPALSTHISTMDEYDTIFIGYPNWDYGAPMAVIAFLEDYDVAGKRIIPFCSHGTGGLSSSVNQIRRAVPQAKVDAPIGISRDAMADAPQQINAWLSSLSQ